MVKFCSMHVNNLGLTLTANGGAMKALMDAGIWGAPAISEDKLDQLLDQAFEDFKMWRKAKKVPCSQKRFRSAQLKKNVRGYYFAAKAYNSRILLHWLAERCTEAACAHPDQPDLGIHAVALQMRAIMSISEGSPGLGHEAQVPRALLAMYDVCMFFAQIFLIAEHPRGIKSSASTPAKPKGKAKAKAKGAPKKAGPDDPDDNQDDGFIDELLLGLSSGADSAARTCRLAKKANQKMERRGNGLRNGYVCYRVAFATQDLPRAIHSGYNAIPKVPGKAQIPSCYVNGWGTCSAKREAVDDRELYKLLEWTFVHVNGYFRGLYAHAMWLIVGPSDAQGTPVKAKTENENNGPVADALR
ncbi:hypothetical protein AK812_SmicGene17179 [Symbiodinium microadriaticum]|uniref:Uncharacterized protein n=1 Tax=Symbiodinium microadriaticum TaxID=2951 RepID=A0A1Q9DYB8_SYMMI|nr:hypothetical protein AK812_SmicGene17179 [Symbiodinium microadriaticum]